MGGVVGVYMAFSRLPASAGPLPFCFLVPLLVFNACWRVMWIYSTEVDTSGSNSRQLSADVSDSQLLGWAIACFVIVFCGLSGIIGLRVQKLNASTELERHKESYFLQDGHGRWSSGSRI